MILQNKGTQAGLMRFRRKLDCLNVQSTWQKKAWQCRHDLAVLVRIRFVAANVKIGHRLQMGVIDARQSVFFEIDFARHIVETDLIRLEDGPKTVIIGLREGIVFMVMALAAIDRQSEKSLAGVFDRLIEPGGTIELEIVPGEEPRRAQRKRSMARRPATCMASRQRASPVAAIFKATCLTSLMIKSLP